MTDKFIFFSFFFPLNLFYFSEIAHRVLAVWFNKASFLLTATNPRRMWLLTARKPACCVTLYAGLVRAAGKGSVTGSGRKSVPFHSDVSWNIWNGNSIFLEYQEVWALVTKRNVVNSPKLCCKFYFILLYSELKLKKLNEQLFELQSSD